MVVAVVVEMVEMVIVVILVIDLHTYVVCTLIALHPAELQILSKTSDFLLVVAVVGKNVIIFMYKIMAG